MTDMIEKAYSNETFLYFDIETIPCQDPEYLKVLEDRVTPPGNIKKQESIDKWLAENREQAAKDAMAKTSFDGGRGHVCTIAWAKNDSEITVRRASSIDVEARAISSFFSGISRNDVLVGHNITGFDLGFLRKRAICLGVKMPSGREFPRDPKPWDKTVFDTMTAWAGGKDRISMDNLCNILGIEGKQGFDGSMVADAWARGEHERIAEYCKDDVWRTREIHKRFILAGY